MPTTLTPTAAANVEAAEALTAARRDVDALRVRLAGARDLPLERADQRALIAQLTEQLREAEDKYSALWNAITARKRQAAEAQEAARRAADLAIREEAKAILVMLLPLVERIDVLNASLEGLRQRLNNPSDIPGSFRPHIMTTTRWLQSAKRFVGRG